MIDSRAIEIMQFLSRPDGECVIRALTVEGTFIPEVKHIDVLANIVGEADGGTVLTTPIPDLCYLDKYRDGRVISALTFNVRDVAYDPYGKPASMYSVYSGPGEQIASNPHTRSDNEVWELANRGARSTDVVTTPTQPKSSIPKWESPRGPVAELIKSPTQPDLQYCMRGPYLEDLTVINPDIYSVDDIIKIEKGELITILLRGYVWDSDGYHVSGNELHAPHGAYAYNGRLDAVSEEMLACLGLQVCYLKDATSMCSSKETPSGIINLTDLGKFKVGASSRRLVGYVEEGKVLDKLYSQRKEGDPLPPLYVIPDNGSSPYVVREYGYQVDGRLYSFHSHESRRFYDNDDVFILPLPENK